MVVYQIEKTVQKSDGDDWGQWIEEEAQSLHSSKEGAEKKIQFLLNKEVEKLELAASLFSFESLEEDKEMLRNNLGLFRTTLNKKEYSKHTLYTIREVTLED